MSAEGAEQEALAAAEKVAELLDRYGLSLNELEFKAQPCEGIGIQTTRRRAAPIDECIRAIAASSIAGSGGNAPRMRRSATSSSACGDVAAAQYLYELVERAFETETGAFRASEIYLSMRANAAPPPAPSRPPWRAASPIS